MEVLSNMGFVNAAKGKVLINGLGLGMVLTEILKKSEVTEVTVIEKSKEVIELVGSYFKDSRLTIINADAFEYKPPKGKRYDCVWYDIWDYICVDNIEEMKKLHRKYGRRTDWQRSWKRDECEHHRRQDNRRGFY
jgi:spermidine synthase